jgi:hypothetical protein
MTNLINYRQFKKFAFLLLLQDQQETQKHRHFARVKTKAKTACLLACFGQQ